MKRCLKLRCLLTAMFIFAGVMHFVKPGMFAAVYPAGWPEPLLAVYISGVAEIAGGIGLQIEKARRAAAIGLILLLVAVFPANINMALNAEKFCQFPTWALWLRLPLQFLLIYLAWRARR